MVLIVALATLFVSVNYVSAQTTVGSLDVAGVAVYPPTATIRTVSLPAGSVDAIRFNLSVRHYGSSFGVETRITVRAPGGQTATYSGGNFGWGATGTWSYSGTLPFPQANSAGTWTLEFTDDFPDGANPDHFYNAGSVITFLSSDSTPPVATSVNLVSDNADPSLATAGDTVTLSLGFNEPLAAAPSVTLLGQPVTATGSGTTWSASVTVGGTTPEGAVTFAVSNYGDAAGNGGNTVTATTDNSAVAVDRTVPTLTISGVPQTYLPGNIFVVTFTFTENVTGFDATDAVVTGGALSNFQATSMSVYTATLTPGGTSDVTVTVADGAGQDDAGNPSVGAFAVSTIASGTVASEEIAHFMENRARALVQAQPGLMRFLNGRTANGSLAASASESSRNLNFASGTEGAAWAAVQASKSETATHDLDYALLTFGAHIHRSDSLVIGGMVQVDTADQTSATGIHTKGTGAMAGPYVVSQIADQPLYVEGRLLYGLSENEITPLGTFTDEFTTERWLARVGVEGEYEAGGVTLFPNLNFSHTQDSQRTYVDGLGNTVPTQSIKLTELDVGLDFEAPTTVSGGEFILTGGLSRAWSSTQATGLAANYIDAGERWDGRIDIGLRYVGDSGVTISTGAYLAGIVPNSPHRTRGGELFLEYRF